MAWLVDLLGLVASLVAGPAVAAQGAVRVAETVAIGPPPATVAVSGPCAQWHDTAIGVGWDDSEWPHVARIMWCESKCEPTAHNRSGASGLMQIMPGWWHGRDPYDPSTNLTMAKEVRDAQGWPAWSCN